MHLVRARRRGLRGCSHSSARYAAADRAAWQRGPARGGARHAGHRPDAAAWPRDVPVAGIAGARHGLLGVPTTAKQRTIYDAQGHETLPGKMVRAEGAAGVAGRAKSTRRTTVSARRSISTPTSTTAIRSTTKGCISTRPCTTGAATTTRSGTASRWCSATATAISSTASRSRSTSSRHELTHGVTGDEAHLVYLGQAGRAERIDLRRVRLARQAIRAQANRRQGRLADRRRDSSRRRSTASRCAR